MKIVGNCQNTADRFGSELNSLSGEMNQRITQGMNGLMNSVSLQIHRAINEAINEQVLSQLQASLRSVSELPHSDGTFRVSDRKKTLEILLAGKSEVVLELSSSET